MAGRRGRRSAPAGDLGGFREALAAGRYARNIHHQRSLPAVRPRWRPLPASLDPRLRQALESTGTPRLYSHQAEALEAMAAGDHVLVATPTASGKSLIYQLPALQAALAPADPGRSLFLFPYKALAQDQLRAVRELAGRAFPLGGPTAEIYDGDTEESRRRAIRADPPHVLITNPDMLHLAILAHHASWAGLLRSLRQVVVDELHVYRGVFGAHLHHVLRRLRRLCRHYGSDPRFLVSSATVANPGEFAEALLGVPVTVVDRSGAPRSRRHFVFLNPPGSPYTAAAHLLTEAMDAGLRTVAFTKARRITELVQRWIVTERPDLRRRLAAYRAGYLPEERRAIEGRLQSGDLLGVVSTSALELGVDIGGLDVCILVGYPGSMAQFWQRTGRVGRRERDSLVVWIGMPDALDQYLLRHPERLFEGRFEPLVADPGNPEVSRAHLICAGAELPLEARREEPEFPPGTLDRVREMAARGDLVLDAAGDRLYSLRRRPQRDVNLRSSGGSFSIVHGSRTIGRIDGVRAFHECHPGAIYLHAGAQFRVASLDRERHRIQVEPSDDDYYTEVTAEKETEILEVHREESRGVFRACLGRLRVTEEIKGYNRRRLFGQEVISSHPLDLPPIIFETVGLWLDLPEALRQAVRVREGHFMGALHALEHGAISLFPLLAIADRSDIGGISYPLHPQTGRAAVFIYDGHPGGIGLAARAFDRLDALLAATRDLVAGCPCDEGCPSCIHSPKCGNGNKPLDKAAALWVGRALLGEEPLAATAPAGCPAAAVARAPQDRGPEAPADPEREQRDPRQAMREPPPAGRTPVAASTAGERRAAATPAAASAPPEGLPEGKVLSFDLETRRSAEEVGGWGNARLMGLALAVVEDLTTGEVRAYGEERVQDLVIDLLSADLVVGFNVKRFDYTVLEGYVPAGTFRRVPTLDLLEEIHRRLGFRVRLADVAQATLGRTKSADGLQSLRWFQEGRLDLVEEYCRRDVEVTAALYRFGRARGYILYPDRQGRAMRVPVAW